MPQDCQIQLLLACTSFLSGLPRTEVGGFLLLQLFFLMVISESRMMVGLGVQVQTGHGTFLWEAKRPGLPETFAPTSAMTP